MNESAGSAGSRPTAMTSSELRLVQIWKDTLQVLAIGIDDDFFALGGDSMLMMQILSRIREEFGVELSGALVFQCPTPRAILGMIGDAASGEVGG